MHGPAFGTVKCSPPEGITLNGYYVPGGTELSVGLMQYMYSPVCIMCIKIMMI